MIGLPYPHVLRDDNSYPFILIVGGLGWDAVTPLVKVLNLIYKSLSSENNSLPKYQIIIIIAIVDNMKSLVALISHTWVVRSRPRT